MYWQENDHEPEVAIADDVVDVLFSLQCRSLPVDHAYALSRALVGAVPWLADEPLAAIHTIHVAGSQNGWERPAPGGDQQLLLSRRTKLQIRVPKERIADLKSALEQITVDVSGTPMKIGTGKERPLSQQTTLFARYVVAVTDRDEDAFLRWAANELARLGVGIRKALCGKTTLLALPTGPIAARSLMLADLRPEESMLLQRHGLGPHRDMGCGIFIPHKGIEAIGKTSG